MSHSSVSDLVSQFPPNFCHSIYHCDYFCQYSTCFFLFPRIFFMRIYFSYSLFLCMSSQATFLHVGRQSGGMTISDLPPSTHTVHSTAGSGMRDRSSLLAPSRQIYVHWALGWINFGFFENFKLPHVACAQGVCKNHL